jgi:hypothetical protein
MATERQIKANRENAKRSTGPKTAAGRLRSSRNSLRHGLSLPLTSDPAASAKADQIAQMLVPEKFDDAHVMAATEFAQEQAELMRIRAVRKELTPLDLASGATNIEQLRRLAALDRYERLARTKRRRAARRLSIRSDQQSQF